MRKFYGKTAAQGLAVGPALVIKESMEPISRDQTKDPEEEIRRVRQAMEESMRQLQELYDKAVKEVGEAEAAIFSAHQMLLGDLAYWEDISGRIRRERVNAEYAVEAAGDHFSRLFADREDACLNARAADIRDVSRRLIRNLTGNPEKDFGIREPSIVIAGELTPSELVRMEREKILAFVTVHGSVNSHAAILARMLAIPALVGVPVDLSSIGAGTRVIVDGVRQEVLFEPTEAAVKAAYQRMEEEQEKARLLQALKGKDNVTLRGRRLQVYANIGGPEDVREVLENDGGGVGLFRSEFLYLEREDFPSEEEQLQAYRQVLQTMGEKKVVIRTLDIGADKQADYFGLAKEENPALGCRGIRFCLKQPEIFKTQLRALLRASVYGNLSILYPMITSVEEVYRIQVILGEVQQELKGRAIPYRLPEQGIMIETPAAVMISDELAELVDFFSIGTNDLTQYTLAADRENEGLEEFYRPRHKAVLRMIQLVACNAHAKGKWVGICGELGADLELTEELVRLGVDEFSVVSGMILPLRKRIRELDC